MTKPTKNSWILLSLKLLFSRLLPAVIKLLTASIKNKMSPANVLCVTAVTIGVLLFPIPCLVNAHCAKFVFPDEVPGSNQLKVPAGSNVTIRFRLDLSGCPEHIVDSASLITVAQSEAGRRPLSRKDVCKWLLQQGQCTVSFQRGCLCPHGEGLYSVLTTVHSSDQDSRWIWRLTLKQSESLDREIQIKINNESQTADSLNNDIIVIIVVITLVVVTLIVAAVIVGLVVRKARRTNRRPSVPHLIRVTRGAIHSAHIYEDLGNRKITCKSQGENSQYKRPGSFYEIPDAATLPPPRLPLKPGAGRSAADGDPLPPPPPPLPAATTATRASFEFPPPPSPEVLLALDQKWLEPLMPLPQAGSTHHPLTSPLSSTLPRGSRAPFLPSGHDRASGAAPGSGPFRLPVFYAKAKNVQGRTSYY